MIVIAAGLLIGSAGQARAGGSGCCNGSCSNDGIAASPKLRAMLDERCKSKCLTGTQVTSTTTITRQTDVAASPKVQQMRAENRRAPVVQATETAGYQPTGADGITASPKLRAALNERPRPTVEIAPLK